MRDIPKQIDLWSWKMSELYNSLEGEIIRILVKRLNNGYADISEWQIQALKDLGMYRKEVSDLLSQVTGVAESEIRGMFESVGGDIINDVDESIPYDPLPKPNDLDNIMRSYYNQCWSGLDNYVNQTLISTNYGYGSTATLAYTQTLSKVQALFNTGLHTLPEAIESAVSQLANAGIRSTFIDKGGHTWSIERYARTVLQSTLSNTYNDLRISRMSEYGVHTVVVTSHMGARKACSKIQGNVVDLRQASELPQDSEYRSIYDPYWQAEYGTPGGHRGCNCKHNWIVFMPGINTNNQPKFDEKENEEVRKLITQQRKLERSIVKCQKNKIVASEMGNKDGAKLWGQKLRGYRGRLQTLVDSNKYLSRDYSREKVYTPLNTLLDEYKKYATIKTRINQEKYNRHVQGTNEYEPYYQRGTKSGGTPSYLTMPADKMQILLDGMLSEKDVQKQRVTKEFGETIGVFVNQTTGERQYTTRGTIHMSKTGIHVVPAIPRSRR